MTRGQDQAITTGSFIWEPGLGQHLILCSYCFLNSIQYKEVISQSTKYHQKYPPFHITNLRIEKPDAGHASFHLTRFLIPQFLNLVPSGFIRAQQLQTPGMDMGMLYGRSFVPSAMTSVIITKHTHYLQGWVCKVHVCGLEVNYVFVHIPDVSVSIRQCIESDFAGTSLSIYWICSMWTHALDVDTNSADCDNRSSWGRSINDLRLTTSLDKVEQQHEHQEVSHRWKMLEFA